MGLRPKVACKPHAPDAKPLCKHWQRLGALLPRKCAALFLISNRLTACLKSRQPMFRPQMNLSTLRNAIYLHNAALARLAHGCASSSEALNFGSKIENAKKEKRNAVKVADIRRPP